MSVTVWGTGIGIDAVDLERIFESIAQTDSSLSRRHKGTGLGLALSRRLAESLGGTLMVDSELGAGSQFTLTLPVGDGSTA